MTDKQIRVSSNVIFKKGNQVLLGLRKGASGAGQWGFPGGHVEYGESFTETAYREMEEETGLIIGSMEFAGIINHTKHVQKLHYIHAVFVCENFSGEPEVREPEKCEGWQWFAVSDIPDNLFFAHRSFLKLLDSKSKLIEE